ncbi:MAG: hypothetical protein ACFFDI_20385 [Promethearchaeota archaeon]
MNFLITNMIGFRNKGCEATTKAVVNRIAKLQDGAKFKIFAEALDYDAFWKPKYKTARYLVFAV